VALWSIFWKHLTGKKELRAIPSFWPASLKYKDITSLRETTKPTNGKLI
jgi:hypothetical protein